MFGRLGCSAPEEDARFRGTVRAFETDADGRSERLAETSLDDALRSFFGSEALCASCLKGTDGEVLGEAWTELGLIGNYWTGVRFALVAAGLRFQGSQSSMRVAATPDTAATIIPTTR